MKNLVKLIGIIPLVVVIGFAFMSCKKDSLNGTTWETERKEEWRGGFVHYVLTFKSPNFTFTKIEYEDGEIDQFPEKGKYTVSGSTVNLTFDDNTKTGTISGETLTFDDKTFTKK